MFRIIQDRLLLARPSRVLDHRPLQIFVGELAQGESLARCTLFFDLSDELALPDDGFPARRGIEGLADPPTIDSDVGPSVAAAAVKAHDLLPDNSTVDLSHVNEKKGALDHSLVPVEAARGGRRPSTCPSRSAVLLAGGGSYCSNCSMNGDFCRGKALYC